LTPYEFFQMAEGYNRIAKRENENIIVQSWYTAYLTRVSEFPKLKDILPKDEAEQPKQQTPEQMAEIFKCITAACGGNFVEN
jgi:hypothetical protein